LDSRALRFRLHLLGAAAFAAYAALATLSYAQAAVLWPAATAPRAAALFERLAPHLSALGLSELFADATAVVVARFIPLAVASAVFLATILTLTRRGAEADAGVVRLLARWSIAFAAVSVMGYPVFTQDFWLSAAWGRMIAAGRNPFHALFTPDDAAGLPLDHFAMAMSYGPLWGVASAAVMAVAGSSALLAAVLFKAVLAAAWVGALTLILRITDGAGAAQRSLAVAIFGWIPVGVTETLLEGHNDIAMTFFALLWLALLLRGRGAAPLALAAATLCKYATAPLFLVDALQTLRRERLPLRAYALRMAAPALLVAALFALFLRSPAFFDGLRLIAEWHFLRPADAVSGLGQLAGLDLAPVAPAAMVLFPAIALWMIVAAFRQPDTAAVMKAALATMAAVIFAAAHLWPWYLVWLVAPAALIPAWWLSRFALGIAFLAPFTIACWWVPELADGKEVAALAMYGGAMIWALASRAAGTAAAAVPARPTGRREA
jgi:alpha-1,6-mannosyltransferase